MDRFLREVRNESSEYRGGAVKVEEQKQELANQFRILKQSVNQTLMAANKPLSPRAVRHSLTPRPIKTAAVHHQNYLTPQVNKSRTRRSGSFQTQYPQNVDYLDEKEKEKEEKKESNSRPGSARTKTKSFVFSFPETLDEI